MRPKSESRCRKTWKYRCVDDPVPDGTAATMEQHDGYRVIRSGFKLYFALRETRHIVQEAVTFARFASRASASAATSDECDGTRRASLRRSIRPKSCVQIRTPLLRARCGKMVGMPSDIPNVVKCEHCGRLSPVMGWVPIYEDQSPIESMGTPPRVNGISCKLECSKCGIIIQVMPPPKKYAN